MKMSFPTALHETRLIWRRLILVILATFAVLLAAEAVIRILVASGLIHTPGIGSVHPELNVKIPLMDRFATDYGRIDCVFIGSSMFDDSVNPEYFSQEYQSLSGESIHCFNISIASLTAESAFSLSTAISQRYHPRLIIYGISPRDITSDFDIQARPLVHDAWMRYQSGEFSVTGWLREYSYLVRSYLSLISLMNPANRDSLNRINANVQPDGYYRVDRNNLSMEGQNIIAKWSPNPDDMRGLKKLLKAGMSNNPGVILVETPVHDNLLQKYIEGNRASYFVQFQKPLSDLEHEYGGEFIISVTPTLSLPDTEWGDVKHLNYKGAEVFSRWLAQQIWQQIRLGTIKDPFQP